MGKWPILDKLEMIDSPIDDDTYERQLKKLQRQLLDAQIAATEKSNAPSTADEPRR